MTDGQILFTAILVLFALCWAAAQIVSEILTDQKPGETPEEREHRRREEYVMRDPRLRKMRALTLSLNATADALEATNKRLAAQLADMKADRSLEASVRAMEERIARHSQPADDRR